MARWQPTIESGSGFVNVRESGSHGGRIQGGWLTEAGARNRIQGGWLTEAGARNRIQGGWLTEAGARNRIQGGWLTESGAGFVTVPESGLSLWGDDPPAYSFLEDEEPSSPYSFDVALELDPDIEADMVERGLMPPTSTGTPGVEDDEAGGVEASGGMSDADALKWGQTAGEYFATASDLILGLMGKQGGAVPPPPSDYPAPGASSSAYSPLRRILPIAAGIAAVGGLVYFVSKRKR